MVKSKVASTLLFILCFPFITGFNAVNEPSLTPSNSLSAELANGAKFYKSECWFEVSNTDVECGWFHTAPETNTNQSLFQLPVVIFRYDGEDRREDPIIYLAGGPGSGAWLDKKSVEKFWNTEWQTKITHMKRDLVLFDQRGSGLSKPRIYCPDYKEHAINVLLTPLSPEENAQQYHNVNSACHSTLSDSNLPIKYLATHYSANDVISIMEILGYDTWNIQGVSYGTRLGIEVQRRYPEKVRTLMLDSAYPPTAHLFQEWPKLLNDSLERMFSHCESDAVCNASAAEFRARFWSLMARLKTSPLLIELDHQDIKLNHVMLNDEILLAIIFHSEYRTKALANISNALFGLEKGEITDFKPLMEDYLLNLFDGSSSEAVYWAVECHDNPPINQDKYLAEKAKYGHLAEYISHDNQICDIWNQGYGYVALNNKANKQTPVLILSGEDDPITPTDWAVESAAAFDNNAYLFSFYGVSHSVLDNKPCAYELYSNFLHVPEKRPRADCTVPSQNDSTFAHDDTEEIDLTLLDDAPEDKDMVASADSDVIRLPSAH